jgi:myo-inositol-1(or 4)-monophosphatase
MSDFRDFALDVAEQACSVATEYFDKPMNVERKADNSPVTIADKKINQMVIEAVIATFPEHRVVGEEGSHELAGAEYAWVCDPIDGTVPFSTGISTFAFSLALVRDGHPVLGVIAEPIQKRVFAAELDQGATLNGRPVHVNSEMHFEFDTIFVESLSSEPRCRRLRAALDEAWLCTLRLHSCVYSGAKVINGSAAALVSGSSHPWDSAALAIIGREAGAVVTDLNGNDDVRFDEEMNGMILAANADISTRLQEMLKTG